MEELVLCLIVSLISVGFFNGVEMAFVSVNTIAIEIKTKQGNRRARFISEYLANPEKFITSALIGLNISLIIFSVILQKICAPLWKNSFWDLSQQRFLILVLELTISSSLIFVLGEFLPKAIFKSKKEYLLILLAPVIYLIFFILSPVTSFFVFISEKILNLIAGKVNAYGGDVGKKVFTYVDLEHFISSSNIYDDTKDAMHKKLLKNVLQFSKTQLKDCLIPRNEVKAININASIAEVKEKFIELGISRMIVYKKNLDNILGYIHQLDLYTNPTSLKSILIEIPIFSESTKINKALAALSQKQKTLGWIVDEYGVTAGIITMEKILEEVFGKTILNEEHYVDTSLIEKQTNKKEFIFSGRLELDYLKEKYNINLPKGEFETLSGFLINYHGTIPKLNEVIDYDNYVFRISMVSNKKIEKVYLKVKKL